MPSTTTSGCTATFKAAGSISVPHKFLRLIVVKDLIAYLRPWQPSRLDPGAVPGLIVPGLVPGLLVVRLEVLAGLVLGAIAAFIIDRDFIKASIYSLAGAVLSFFGFIHGAELGYVFLAGICFWVGRHEAKPVIA